VLQHVRNQQRVGEAFDRWQLDERRQKRAADERDLARSNDRRPTPCERSGSP
jgi:hypothetical protein